MAAGLTQEELGERIGTSGQQVSRLEKQDRRLTADWMEKLSRGLAVSPMALFEPSDTGEFVDDEKELILLGSWRELPPERRERVLDFIRFELSTIGPREGDDVA